MLKSNAVVPYPVHSVLSSLTKDLETFLIGLGWAPPALVHVCRALKYCHMEDIDKRSAISHVLLLWLYDGFVSTSNVPARHVEIDGLHKTIHEILISPAVAFPCWLQCHYWQEYLNMPSTCVFTLLWYSKRKGYVLWYEWWHDIQVDLFPNYLRNISVAGKLPSHRWSGMDVYMRMLINVLQTRS